MPSGAGLDRAGEPILITLFQYGEFDGFNDVNMAALSLRALSLGLVAFMLIGVLAPGFYARKDTATGQDSIVAMGSQHGHDLRRLPILMYFLTPAPQSDSATCLMPRVLNAGLLCCVRIIARRILPVSARLVVVCPEVAAGFGVPGCRSTVAGAAICRLAWLALAATRS
ncbi:MAG: lipid II flippase MurJ [Halioglobus sp.]